MCEAMSQAGSGLLPGSDRRAVDLGMSARAPDSRLVVRPGSIFEMCRSAIRPAVADPRTARQRRSLKAASAAANYLHGQAGTVVTGPGCGFSMMPWLPICRPFAMRLAYVSGS